MIRIFIFVFSAYSYAWTHNLDIKEYVLRKEGKNYSKKNSK